MKNQDEQSLEGKVDRASSIRFNMLEDGIGIALLASTSIFPDYSPFTGYQPLVNIAGISLLYHGSQSIYKKVRYLKGTCYHLLKSKRNNK